MHVVKFNQGAQTLRFVPMDELGHPHRVTAANYTIIDLRRGEDDPQREVVASTAATLGSASTTLDDSAGPTASHGDANRLPVTATDDFSSGRTYLLERADGSARETVIVTGVDASGGRLYGLTAIQHTYASGDLLRACELEATFPALEASNEESVRDGGGPYQVLWTYTLQGQSWCVPQSVWLSRYDFAPLCTDADVLMLYPPLADRGRGRFTVRMALSAATDDLVAELLSADVDVAQYRLSPTIRQAVRHKAVEYMLRWCQTDQDAARADLFKQNYDRWVVNLLQGRPGKQIVKVDRVEDAAAPTAQVDTFLVPG